MVFICRRRKCIPARKTIRVLFLIALWMGAAAGHDTIRQSAGAVKSDYDVFAELWLPNGLEFAGNGNLLVLHCDDAASGFLSEYEETGQLVNRKAEGSLTGYLARDPQSGSIFCLGNDSLFYSLDPVSKEKTLLFNIRELDISLKTVYDVHWDRISNYGSLINLKYCSYGDFVVHQMQDRKILFICGVAQLNTIPFILRVRLSAGSQVEDALVLMASDISSDLEHARGIALNKDGKILTTFPEQSGDWPFQHVSEVPVLFSADFEPADGVQTNEKPQEPFPPGAVDIASQGMTCDNAGNFYIVTSSYGAIVADSLYPGGNLSSGCLLVLPATLKPIRQIYFPPELMLVNFADVVINPQNTKAYITVTEWKEDIFDYNLKTGRVITYPVEATAIEPPQEKGPAVTGYRLYRNYPNPFNPATAISFFLPAAGQARLAVYNTLGEAVAVLLDRRLPAGIHRVEWRPLPRQAGGVYYYRLETGQFIATGKMIYLK